jgi:hypothetical protein
LNNDDGKRSIPNRSQEAQMARRSDTTPIACTLTSAGLSTQIDRWKQLAVRAVTERLETADGLRISFRPESGVEDELRELVAVENECCAWADWNVEATAEQIVLDIRSSGEGLATLHGMFTF